jgi:hypothetical protein
MAKAVNPARKSSEINNGATGRVSRHDPLADVAVVVRDAVIGVIYASIDRQRSATLASDGD